MAGPTLDAAASLLGVHLVRSVATDGGGLRIGRIVEVEAYLGPEDRASHARAGPTTRTAPMFGPPGAAYVYLVYGMYHCLNVVTEAAGRAGAVLIRAIEPIEGIAAMRAALAGHGAARRRAPQPGRQRRSVPNHRLTAGPGLVAAALSVDRGLTGLDLCDPASPLRLELPHGDIRPVRAVAGPRIGIAHAGEPWTALPYRLVDASSPSLSRRAPWPADAEAG
ncbi:MAG: DNA-3-methyladenine glycosylase [Anaerolinea sp.]|nr:DNA-3-methyladenine glycosylase [Anaerolinea sp.]